MEASHERYNQTAKTCAFTGHRSPGKDFDPEALDEVILQLLKEGVRTFYNGLAVGFDLMAAELVLSHLSEYPDIRLVACIPCDDQNKYYSADDKIRYDNILLIAEQVVLSARYYSGCMLARDRYMADRADILVTYCRKQTGGTAYTVNYFQRKYPEGRVIPL